MIDKNVLKNVIAKYKKDFSEWWEINENYKWEAAKWFQDNWKENAEDFAEMLHRSLDKTDTLLATANHYPRAMIEKFAYAAPDVVRAMFADLYDEDKDVYERIAAFKKQASVLLKEYGDGGKNHYQDENAISTYLWLKFPEKYYIYKYSSVKEAGKVLNSAYEFKEGNYALNIRNYVKLYDEINAELKQDTELMKLLQQYLKDDKYYSDPNLKTLTSDIGYYIHKQYIPDPDTIIHIKSYSQELITAKNIIFHGAPGTGKTYLARQIAAYIVSEGTTTDYASLKSEQKKHVEFVQFHPSYDYTDFVEGLRPRINADGTMSFELQDGIFKKFVARARKNYEDSQKTSEVIEKESTVQEVMSEFFSEMNFGEDTFTTKNGSEFIVTGIDDKHIYISIPANAISNKLILNLDQIQRMLESDKEFKKIKDLKEFFGTAVVRQEYSYIFALYKEIKKRMNNASKVSAEPVELKKYVFIIDEINRGEISKILGELFFSIDPDYRGKAGEVSTQYANLHSDPDEKFYVPDNVYIIGTMNDIDRSVDSFDFAMRRRFRFIELKADANSEMLDELGDKKDDAAKRMTELNEAIAETEGLNENYQIGPAYFLKLKDISPDKLWTDHLKPLLQDYVQGMYNEEDHMKKFASNYGYNKSEENENNEEAPEDQGQ